MEDEHVAMEEIKKIRSLMERSSIYHSLSGLSGVAAGCIGILVYAVVYGIVNPLLGQQLEISYTNEGRISLITIFFIASVICVALAFAAIFYFNWLKARRKGLPFFEPAMEKMFLNLFIPLATGGIYCIALMREQEFLLIAPSMLIFYGLGMLMASRHTIAEIRYLGIIELMLGLIAIFFKEYGMWFWLLGFGFVNLLYGAYIYFRYER